MPDHEVFELGDVLLQSGATLHAAKLAYKTHGELNAARDNAIVLPTYYAGKHADYEPLIGEGRALDPARYFIIVMNMFSNGLSSSPSNTAVPFNGPKFPRITHWDNVHCQHRLVTEVLGVERVALAAGFSMGGQQANYWAALFPDMVERLAPWCSSAKTSNHNWVFLEGVKAALVNAIDFHEGWYTTPPVRGLRAFARVYAGWGPSPAFYREEKFKLHGFSSPDDFMIGFWENRFLGLDANDLLGMLYTWQRSDISDNSLFNGNYRKACRAIRADTLLLPSATDQYFPVEDNRIQKRYMSHAEVRPIPTAYGHIGGAPGLSADSVAFIDGALKELLGR